jgi:glycosyltransferase involved in cell wall biosynthesis
MKIAVYTIAKNEEQFVERWADSCRDADYRLILDTGSTDGTLVKADQAGVEWFQKEFNPWRFDHARNYALSIVPLDIDLCIALDMDEILLPGWREALEAMPLGITRPRYKYVWSWNEDGTEGLVYGGDKIHHRHGYKWKHPVHEVITPTDPTFLEGYHFVPGLEIHHHPDQTKSRGQYFDLLKLAVEEDPMDDRNQFYLAREYFFHRQYKEATRHFKKHLELSHWGAERAASCRYLAKCQFGDEEHWLWRAVAEDPMRRENWVDIAEYHYWNTRDWVAVRSACQMAFRITDKPLDYLCETKAWGWLPHDLMAIASHQLGDTDEAWYHGAQAVALKPGDERLERNLQWYRG